jgi:hypothetical protein
MFAHRPGLRRTMLGVVGVGATVALMATPAFAHECYNASRSDTGNIQIGAHSPAFNTLDEVAMGFFTAPAPDGLGLCPAGAQYLLDQLHAAAAQPGSTIDTTWVVSNRTVQASGLDNSPNARAQQNLSNGTGIDHLGENAEIGAIIGANIGAAIGMCS